MGDLVDVRQAERDGEPGFEADWKLNGINRMAVRGRAISRLAAQFPLKAPKMEAGPGDVELVDDDGGMNTYIVTVFIPMDGFLDAPKEMFMELIEGI